ncbi:hypothetical protein [Microbacterium terrisoli]|uniref:hypothetical protein n=1 Tax=Microbacterium terrisoli TaxID=3242192 RepID=UPI00280438FD|nr:hypothetical protein [Microbacterium protaetiae]
MESKKSVLAVRRRRLVARSGPMRAIAAAENSILSWSGIRPEMVKPAKNSVPTAASAATCDAHACRRAIRDLGARGYNVTITPIATWPIGGIGPDIALSCGFAASPRPTAASMNPGRASTMNATMT